MEPLVPLIGVRYKLWSISGVRRVAVSRGLGVAGVACGKSKTDAMNCQELETNLGSRKESNL